MMQVIRDRAQGIVAWTIVVLIAITFAIWGLGDIFGPSTNPLAAKVDGHKITWHEIDAMYQQWLHANRDTQNASTLPPSKVKLQLRDRLVHDRALLSQAVEEGYIVSESLLLNEVRKIPQFQQDGQFSLERYQQIMHHYGMSEREFESLTRQDIMREQMRRGLNDSAFILPQEATTLFQLWRQQRDFGYVIINPANFTNQIKLSAQEVEQYFAEHQSEFKTAERVKLEYIELSLPAISAQVEPTDAALLTFYQSHLDYYQNPERLRVRHLLVRAPQASDAEKSGEARDKIDDILAKAKLGQDFAELARQYSDDKISAQQGGDLGDWIKRGETEPEFEQAAFSLSQANQISDIVKTQFGYHLIQLIERQEPEVPSFESVQAKVRADYQQEAAERMFNDKAEEMANLAFENKDSLQPVSEHLNLPVQTSLWIEAGAANPSIDPAVLTAAFSEALLVEQTNSDLIKLNANKYWICRVQEHAPARPKTLAETREDITTHLKFERAKQIASTTGQAIREKLELGNAPHQITQAQNLQWVQKDKVLRFDNQLDPTLLQHVFALPHPNGKPQLADFALLTGEYAVVALTQVSHGVDPKQADSKFADEALRIKMQLELSLFHTALVKQAKIQYMDLPEYES